MKQVFVRSALEAVLAAAAERPPSNEGAPSPPNTLTLTLSLKGEGKTALDRAGFATDGHSNAYRE